MKLYEELVRKYIPENKIDCFELSCIEDCALFGTGCLLKIEKVE